MRRTLDRRSALPLPLAAGLLAGCLAGLFAVQPAAASGFGLFQHGGRATGQAGAFTARASDPSALTYNPAAIARLPGFQLQAGLDFNNAQDDYSSSTGTFKAGHIIEFPPALYATWHGGGESRWAFGLGIDSPFWYTLDWEPDLFPGRFLQRRIDYTIAEVHPVVALELSENWSFGAGLRYVFGTLDRGDNGIVLLSAQGQTLGVEIERDASVDVDTLAWDVALDYRKPAWGWALVLRSEAELEGTGDVRYRTRNVPSTPVFDPIVAALPTSGRAEQGFTLPAEARTGLWLAPYPELRLEIDLAYQEWSGLPDSNVTFFGPTPFGPGDIPTVHERDWDDTLAVRFGLEGEVTERFVLFGGIGWEPSPVPDDTIDPGFPRGDAIVYAAGFGYNFPKISFDVGYSLHEHDSRGASGQEPFQPGVSGSYSARDQVWGFAVRWRL